MQYGTPEKIAADALFAGLAKEFFSGSRDLEAVSLTGPEVLRHCDQFIKTIGVKSLYIAESDVTTHKKISSSMRHYRRAVSLLPVGCVSQFLLDRIRQDHRLDIIDLDSCGLSTILEAAKLTPQVLNRPGLTRLVFSTRCYDYYELDYIICNWLRLGAKFLSEHRYRGKNGSNMMQLIYLFPGGKKK